MLTLYRIFTFLVYYLTYPYTYFAAIFGSKKWGERLGFLRGHAKSKVGKTIWMHAASMGEVKVLDTLADELLAQENHLSLFVTVTSDAGYQRAISLSRERWQTCFLPLDYGSPAKRFLDIIKPSAAVFIETEIWPNICVELGRRKIPIFLANGRLSDKSSRRYKWFKNGLRIIFSNYRKFMVQSERDKERYIQIGADGDNIEVIGSLKFDAPIVQMPREDMHRLKNLLPFGPACKIFIAGSTRNGEDEIILDTFKKLKAELDSVRLILVPRHLDRIDLITAKVNSQGLPFVLYSKLPADQEKEVVIVDKMGVLNDLYHISDISFVGGTLAELGGHNILEPVWAGIPVLFGSSIFNVEDSAAYITRHNFGEMIKDESDLLDKIKSFLTGQKQYRKKGANSDEISSSRLTAKIILENIDANGKNLAKDNSK